MGKRSDETSRHSGLRTVDVARRVGCSVQHLRNLENEGVVPAAARTSSGYRSWDEVHVLSAVAYRELAQGVGPVLAKGLLRALHHQPSEVFLALLDDAHADLAASATTCGWRARQWQPSPPSRSPPRSRRTP